MAIINPSMFQYRQSECDRRPVPKVSRTVGGERYDSETASVLHHWHFSEELEAQLGHEPAWDIGAVLMETIGKRYFVVAYNELGDIDALTLTPLTTPQAIAWCENHCEWKIDDIFGRMPEAGTGTPYVAVAP